MGAKQKSSHFFSLVVLGTLVITLSFIVISSQNTRRTRVEAAASCTYQASSSWTTVGRPQSLVIRSTDVTVAEMSEGSVGRVAQYSPSGSFIKSYGSFGTALNQLNEPVGVAIAPDKILVGDGYHQGSGKIKKIDTSGNFSIWVPTGTGPGQISAAGGIAITSTGSVYVVDYISSRLEYFDSTGLFKFAWGTQGSAAGQFNFPRDVAVFGDYIYVADTGNNRIQKFHFNGTGVDFVKAWGSFGTGSGNFSSPFGVGIDSAGQVYVADTGNGRIQVFSPDGVFISTFGTSGSGTSLGLLSGPRDIAVDATGKAYVADTGNTRIQIFTCAAPTPTTSPVPSRITYIQTVTGTSSGSSTVSTSSPIVPVAGQLYIATVATKAGREPIASVTGMNLTWARIGGECSGLSSNRVDMYYAVANSAATSTKVTATVSKALKNMIIAVSSFSGENTATPIGASAFANTNGVSGSCLNGVNTGSYSFPLAPTSTGSLIFAGVGIRTRTHTPGSGYTEHLEKRLGSAGDTVGLALESRTSVLPSTVVNGIFNGTTDWTAFAAELK